MGQLSREITHSKNLVLIPDVQADREERVSEFFRKHGFASYLGVPLLAKDGIVGILGFYTREKHEFTQQETDFLLTLAGQAAIAIQNARLMSETLEMKRTLEARKLIERAKGILQYKHSLTEEEAYLRLRNESRRLRRSMRDLAEAVILADDLNRKEGDAKIAVRDDHELV